MPKIVVDTGIVLDHLSGSRSPSVLRQALSKLLCYTTVFQAIELFARAGSARERQAVEDALSAIKILGLNARNAPQFGALMRRAGMADRHVALIAGLCLESRLPLLTDRAEEFRKYRGMVCVPPRLVTESASGQEILKAARRRV